jgi:hypothetical protein
VGGVSVSGDRAQIRMEGSSLVIESKPGSNATVVRDGERSFQADKLRYDWLSRDGYAMGISDPLHGIYYFSMEDLKPVPTTEKFPESPFEFRKTGESPLLIKGSRIVLEPGVEMVFNDAEIIIAGKRRLSLPVFVFSIGGARAGDPRYVGIGPKGVLLDLPYTFAAGPNGIAQARLKYNAPEGLYGSYVAGWAVDLLSRYASRGTMDGTVELSRVTSPDRGFSWTHNQILSPSLQGYVSLDTRAPSGSDSRYTLANLALNYGAKPFTMALSAFGSDSNVTTGNIRLSIQSRPKPLTKGLFWNVGADAGWSWYPSTVVDPADITKTVTTVKDRNDTGVSARLSLPSYKVARTGAINASGSAGVSWSGGETSQTLAGSVGYAQPFLKSGQLRLTYNYSDLNQGPTQIVYTDPVSGEPAIFFLNTVETQTVTTSVTYGKRGWNAGAYGTYGIDQKNWNARLGAQYAIARDWTLRGSLGYFQQRLFLFVGDGSEPETVAYNQTSWQIRLDRALGERALSLVYDSFNNRVYFEYVPGRLF